MWFKTGNNSLWAGSYRASPASLPRPTSVCVRSLTSARPGGPGGTWNNGRSLCGGEAAASCRVAKLQRCHVALLHSRFLRSGRWSVFKARSFRSPLDGSLTSVSPPLRPADQRSGRGFMDGRIVRSDFIIYDKGLCWCLFGRARADMAHLFQVGYGVPAALCAFIGVTPHVTGRRSLGFKLCSF